MNKLLTLALGLLQKYRRFVVYCMIGAVGASLDFILFWYLHESQGVRAALATIPAVSLGITTTFLLNSYFNFKTTDQMKRRFLRFYGVGMLGLLMSVIILQVFTDWLGFDGRVVKVLSLPAIAVFQYTLNARFSFAEIEE